MNGEFETIRVCFSKTGRAKYISHLDLNRTMTRVLRRAQIPLWYTEGFNRHPYITFAAPLSLGYEGMCEYMDFRLEQDMPMQELVQRLNHNMPQGIEVLSAAPAAMKVNQIACSRWRMELAPDREEAVRSLLAAESAEVQKRTKKGTFKTVDIRPMMTDVTLETGERCVLTLTLPTGEVSVNPSLVLSALGCGEDEASCRVTRLGIFTALGERFC
ncbi:MAG: TIGR03936 family radical SAM-associated protein [Acutalibacteraceae bacterium]